MATTHLNPVQMQQPHAQAYVRSPVEIVSPSNQIPPLYSKPSFGVGNAQLLNPSTDGKPQIYRGHRKKFGRTYINILHDPRVVRGNTYAAIVIPSSIQLEFLRMKEEEEKRRRARRKLTKLPRVALLGRNRKEEEETNVEEDKRPDSPLLKQIENKDEVIDKPYFYEDRPPTPKYIPLPPGQDEETQVIDLELFDFEMEVKPILEVLVGRSVVQARYELIEEDERNEYLKHKKEYERKREFELMNLQRTEARYMRLEEEKQRRFKQKEQRKLYDITLQKKLISKVFSKMYLRSMKQSVLNQLQQRGFLAEHEDYVNQQFLVENSNKQVCTLEALYEDIESHLETDINTEYADNVTALHKKAVDAEKERIEKIRQEKEAQRQAAEEEERQRRAAQLARREQRRIERITNSIMTNIISTNSTRKDVMNLPLSDVDELSIRGDCIHCLGGQIGEIMFVFNEIIRNTLSQEDTEKIDMKQLMRAFVEELLLNAMDNEAMILELKYLESPKYDFESIAEERRGEFKDFIKDERRYISKSLKLLVNELGVVNREDVNLFNDVISDLYFKGNVEPEKVEGDPENQEPEYLEKIKLQNEENEKKAAEENAKYEKIKKKIKLVFVKPEVFKNKRQNIGGFVMVEPNDREVDKVTEVEEVVVEPEKKEDENENGEEAAEDNAEHKEGEDDNVEKNDDLKEQQPVQEGEVPEEKKPQEDEQQQQEQQPQEQEQQQQPVQEGEQQQQQPEEAAQQQQPAQEGEEPQVQSKLILYYINTLHS